MRFVVKLPENVTSGHFLTKYFVRSNINMKVLNNLSLKSSLYSLWLSRYERFLFYGDHFKIKMAAIPEVGFLAHPIFFSRYTSKKRCAKFPALVTKCRPHGVNCSTIKEIWASELL